MIRRRRFGSPRSRPFDLLLIDVVVPDEGPELADQVQTASPTTKILLMSGYHTSIAVGAAA